MMDSWASFSARTVPVYLRESFLNFERGFLSFRVGKELVAGGSEGHRVLDGGGSRFFTRGA